MFVVEQSGKVVAHSMVRIESHPRLRLGVFATTYVCPEARRLGVASGLLRHGETWMRERGAQEAATGTAEANWPLIRLFEYHGYRITEQGRGMVRLSKSLMAADATMS